MVRPGRVKPKGSEASETGESSNKNDRRGRKTVFGRPKKGGNSNGKSEGIVPSTSSPSNSRADSPFSPSNPPALHKRRNTRAFARLLKNVEDSEPDTERSLSRLAQYLEKHPEGREEYIKLLADKLPYPSTIRDVHNAYYDGTIFSVGDIVRVTNKKDGLPYFAQIRGLLTDALARSFAALTWLSPKPSALNSHVFDPAHFSHYFVDRKNYPIAAIAYESSRPSLPAYCHNHSMRWIIDERRREALIQRRKALLAAARTERNKGLEVLRAGDVKELHNPKNKAVLNRVLATMAERREERDEAERERRKREEKEKEKEG